MLTRTVGSELTHVAVFSSELTAAPLAGLSQQEEAAKRRFCLITIKQSNKHLGGRGGENFVSNSED